MSRGSKKQSGFSFWRTWRVSETPAPISTVSLGHSDIYEDVYHPPFSLSSLTAATILLSSFLAAGWFDGLWLGPWLCCKCAGSGRYRMVHCVLCSMAKNPKGQSHFRDDVFRLRYSALTRLGGFPARSHTNKTFLSPGTVFFDLPITMA